MHMKNSTMRNWKRSGIRMYTTKRLYYCKLNCLQFSLVSAMTQEGTFTVSMILRQAAWKRSACMKAGRPAGAWEWSGWRLTFTATVRRASLTMMMRRNRWTSADGTQWKNCSAVPMRPIFGRRYRYAIRNTQHITMICTPCSEDGIDVKSQAYGNEERY